MYSNALRRFFLNYICFLRWNSTFAFGGIRIKENSIEKKLLKEKSVLKSITQHWINATFNIEMAFISRRDQKILKLHNKVVVEYLKRLYKRH